MTTLKVMLDRSKEFILTFDGVEVTDDQANNNSRDDQEVEDEYDQREADE